MPIVEYRNPTLEDLDAILDIINISNRDNPLWEVHSPEELRKNTFGHDEWDAEGHWVAVRGEKLLGYGGARITKDRREKGQDDGWLGVWVLPEERARGIENEIMQRSLDYLRERGLGKAKCFDLKGTDWRDTVRHDLGFSIVHREFFMIKRDRELPPHTLPEGLGFKEFLLREATDKQLEDLVILENDAFSEDEYYTPNTMDSLRRWREWSPNIVRINFATMDDEVVGVCISEIELEYNEVHNIKAGWIKLFGVAKAHRNKGIGKALLHNGMSWLWNQGMDTLYVAVDELNPPAERVYKSVGFEIRDEGAIWSLEL
ncbi:MAG: GNAT family N-acetyltransferase [Thermoplasmata archaeon]